MKNLPTPFLCTAAVLATLNLSAQSVFQPAGDTLWSNAANWSTGVVPNSSATSVRLEGSPDVDGAYTINLIQNSFGSTANVISGSGSLLIDRNSSATGNGIFNVAGNAGGSMTFNGNVTVNNSQAGITRINYGNSNANSVVFGASSVLTLTTIVETNTDALGRSLLFNGQITGGANGAANLRFGSGDDNIIFGATADNSGYLGDFVAFSANVVSNTTVDGGFLRAGSKLQVNGSGGSLQLNGANSMDGNFVVDGSNSFTVDFNANQDSLGVIAFSGASPAATLNLNIDAAVDELAFSDSSSFGWGGSAISITGFKENTIRFGTNATGLTQAQLDAIDGGIYSLNSSGYLTIPEPRTYAMLLGIAGLALAIQRRRR